MTNKKPGKGSVTMGIIGICVAVFGIIWTVGANRMASEAFFYDSTPSLILTAGGILFVVIAVSIAIRGFRGDTEEDRENQSQDKATWSCPYCGAAVSEDEAFCPSCGAGRKK